MRKLAVVLFLTSTVMAFGQLTPTVTMQANTIYVGADGRFEAPPDTAVIQFNISAQESTAGAAYDRASKAAQQIRDILRSNGIEPKQAQIGFFAVNPVYDYRTPKRKLVGYRVDSSVTLKLKDFSKVAPIVQQLSDMDVTENQTVSYALENIDAAKVRAVQDAFQRARAEADALARAGGRTLGEMSYASADTSEPIRVVQPMMRARAMAVGGEMAPPPTAEFTPQNIVVTARVNAMFVLR
jgi:uncharacterized protein YggE